MGLMIKYAFLLIAIIAFEETVGKSVFKEALDLEIQGNHELHNNGLDEIDNAADTKAEEIKVETDSVSEEKSFDAKAGRAWQEELQVIGSDTKTPREVVITSLERSDFEHLSEKQFQHIKEMELLLKEEPQELPHVDLNGKSSMEYDEDFHTVSLPTEFTEYDLNKDGKISLEELIETTGAMENVDKAFAASDTDGKQSNADHYFSYRELIYREPWPSVNTLAW